MLVAVLCFTGCSNSGNELKYDKSSIKESTEFLINYCQMMRRFSSGKIWTTLIWNIS